MSSGQDFYIDGAWQAFQGSERLTAINPATEAPVAEVASGRAEDVDAAVAAARRAFPEFSRTPVEERIALIERIAGLIEERMDQFVDAIIAEMGAARPFAEASQGPNGLAHVKVQAEVLKSYEFLKMQGTTAIARQAIGVCALITPWNWPLYQITAKVAPALAAGCTMVLKPSELSPLSAALFAQVVHDAGVPEGVFNMVTGRGEVVGAALSEHPEVDMVSITGSTRAGVLVAQAAAPTVKRVVQELGGKSPNILLDDADFETAVSKGVVTGYRNCGQSCSAPTRMIVPRARLGEVEEIAKRTATGLKVGDPTASDTDLGPIANKAQYGKVLDLIQAGIDEGAKLVCGGTERPEGLNNGYFVAPTVFSNVDMSMRIAREEIFGPVLSILAYDSEEEAIAIANDTRYGLGAHVQSGDQERARRVAAQIRAGQVHLNYPAWDGHAPFGGYKQSGNGREYGVFGLEEYLEVKSIVGY
ncbi:aldehyde dehydrogenase family protein [Tropicimonas sp. IMCC34011]|uniref:aldehyde dehydrogenase family protein n=1 Tax=Tropicimonas sp. IMCC34011 TaxID=2248759 RepID=UPI000E25C91B|nr:aldehyde dehydrogenase family protein [Tropicimonas sp. IMCC34011]